MLSRKIIIGHRGIPSRVHENTVESLLRAAVSGADMVELDIRQTADRVAVAYHDPAVDFPRDLRPLSTLTFDELRSATEKLGFSVPSISQVLKALSGKTKVLFEFKEKGYEEEIIKEVLGHFAKTDVAFQSFQGEIVNKIGMIDPDLTTGYLVEKASQLESAALSKAVFIAPSLAVLKKQRKFFEAQKQGGRKIAIWTVDSPDLIKECLDDTLPDMLITNRCDEAARIQNQLLSGTN
ncbi:MAG: glycerophosphodiester phosphodiesterase [Chitinispirillaceae bacterium]